MKLVPIVARVSAIVVAGVVVFNAHDASLRQSKSLCRVQSSNECIDRDVPVPFTQDLGWQPTNDYDKFQLSREDIVRVDKQQSIDYFRNACSGVTESLVRAVEGWMPIAPLPTLRSPFLPEPMLTVLSRRDSADFAAGLVLDVDFGTRKSTHSSYSQMPTPAPEKLAAASPRVSRVQAERGSVQSTEEDMVAALALSWFATDTPMERVVLPKPQRDW